MSILGDASIRAKIGELLQAQKASYCISRRPAGKTRAKVDGAGARLSYSSVLCGRARAALMKTVLMQTGDCHRCHGPVPDAEGDL